MSKKRCAWVNLKNQVYIDYHDKEWGVPVHNDQKLFEFLILEGAQAGLSWETILMRIENYRKAFDNFNPKIISKYDEKKIQTLLENKSIIRNKLKILSVIKNAIVFLQIQKEFTSFDNYIWSYTNKKVIQNHFNSINQIPSKTELSEKISKDLKKRGMSFVGPTIIYSFMQAVGMVNDHTKDCFRHNQLN
jgi:DNA-3-methyladenine glycosylase I